jgi:hypothetical protein
MMMAISVTLLANYDQNDLNVWLHRRVLEINQNLKSHLLRLRLLIFRHGGFDGNSVRVQVVETWMVTKKF